MYDGEHLRVGKDLYNMESFERMLVVSIGKAGYTMADAFSNIWTRADGQSSPVPICRGTTLRLSLFYRWTSFAQ